MCERTHEQGNSQPPCLKQQKTGNNLNVHQDFLGGPVVQDLCQVKETRHTTIYTGCYHLYEKLNTQMFIKMLRTSLELVPVAKGWGWG